MRNAGEFPTLTDQGEADIPAVNGQEALSVMSGEESRSSVPNH
jgi:hypothetical protein